MVIATIPAKYAAPQTAKTLSMINSSILNPALHFLQRFSVPYSLHYTHFFQEFNHFVQFVFSAFVYFIQIRNPAMNCKKHFLQFILHFPVCIVPVHFLQKRLHPRQNAPHFAGFPPCASNCVRIAASRPAFFRFLPSFLKAGHAKTGESTSNASAGLQKTRQKFVKYRHKRGSHTTISYSPLPPDEK